MKAMLNEQLCEWEHEKEMSDTEQTPNPPQLTMKSLSTSKKSIKKTKIQNRIMHLKANNKTYAQISKVNSSIDFPLPLYTNKQATKPCILRRIHTTKGSFDAGDINKTVYKVKPITYRAKSTLRAINKVVYSDTKTISLYKLKIKNIINPLLFNSIDPLVSSKMNIILHSRNKKINEYINRSVKDLTASNTFDYRQNFSVKGLSIKYNLEERVVLAYLNEYAKLANIRFNQLNCQQLIHVVSSYTINMGRLLMVSKSLSSKTPEMKKKLCECINIDPSSMESDFAIVSFDIFMKVKTYLIDRVVHFEKKLEFLNIFFFSKSEYILKEQFLSLTMLIYFNIQNKIQKKLIFIGQVCSKFQPCMVEAPNRTVAVSNKLFNDFLRLQSNANIVNMLYELITSYNLIY